MTVKGQKDKQRPSRIYKDKFIPPSPLKLVVTVLKWNNIRRVCFAEKNGVPNTIWEKNQSSIAKR